MFENFPKAAKKFPAQLSGGAVKRALAVFLGYARYIIAAFAVVFFFYLWFVSAPVEFPTDSLVTIERGMTLSEASDLLRRENVVRSPLFFKILVRISAGDASVFSGDYFWGKKHTVFGVASRVTKGIFGLEPRKVTIPEGASVEEVAYIVGVEFPEFKKDEFMRRALEDEGYLFPDTYRFPPNVTAAEVHRSMRENFVQQLKEVDGRLEASGRDIHDVVTMASLVEKEARDTETRRMIAGILWQRLAIGMPLQVDAAFLYINGKSTFELTLEDLRGNESPYNTYKYPGLPPGPITNPGLNSILAVLDPLESNYLYYLSDRNGNTYYSATFAEHKEKKARYLR